MSYRSVSLAVLGLSLSFATLPASAAGPANGGSTSVTAAASPTNGKNTPGASADWLAAADEAGRPIAYAAVPLPPAAVGAAGCVALVAFLRWSRHRSWVTLRG